MEGADALSRSLAADQVDGLAAPARALAAQLHAGATAVAQTHENAPLAAPLEASALAAEALARAESPEAARPLLAQVNEGLFAAAAADPRLQEGWTSYRCPMVQHFPNWFQKAGAMANPYMGSAMLSCGVEEGWGDAPLAGPDPDEIAFWTCPMHPSIKGADAGACPICGMDLVPVTHGALDSGEIRIDAIRRQALGIRTAAIGMGPIDDGFAATGIIAQDERRQSAVSLRVSGYVERLRVNETGAVVRRGQALLDLYAPELLATQQELLRAHAAGDAARSRSARERLELWGIWPRQIDEILASGQAQRALPILSPVSGTVIEKDVLEGSFIQSGQRIYQLGDLDQLWMEARVFEDQVGSVAVGDAVTVLLPGPTPLRLPGSVHSVLPVVEAGLRATRVRVALPNPDGALRVGAYGRVHFDPGGPDALRLPREAVIYAGDRRVVFVDRGQDRLQPVEIETGRRGTEWIAVSSGLSTGDVVVVSGNFLVAAESRLQAALGFWGQEAAHDGH